MELKQMSKTNANLSPETKGESEKKKLSESELIEFNMKIPIVFYEFFSALIELFEWDYSCVVEFFEDELVSALCSRIQLSLIHI